MRERDGLVLAPCLALAAYLLRAHGHYAQSVVAGATLALAALTPRTLSSLAAVSHAATRGWRARQLASTATSKLKWSRGSHHYHHHRHYHGDDGGGTGTRRRFRLPFLPLLRPARLYPRTNQDQGIQVATCLPSLVAAAEALRNAAPARSSALRLASLAWHIGCVTAFVVPPALADEWPSRARRGGADKQHGSTAHAASYCAAACGMALSFAVSCLVLQREPAAVIGEGVAASFVMLVLLLGDAFRESFTVGEAAVVTFGAVGFLASMRQRTASALALALGAAARSVGVGVGERGDGDRIHGHRATLHAVTAAERHYRSARHVWVQNFAVAFAVEAFLLCMPLAVCMQRRWRRGRTPTTFARLSPLVRVLLVPLAALAVLNYCALAGALHTARFDRSDGRERNGGEDPGTRGRRHESSMWLAPLRALVHILQVHTARRLALIAFWALVLVLTVRVKPPHTFGWRKITARKWYHLVSLVMFVPAFWEDHARDDALAFLAVAQAGAFAALVVVELTRAVTMVLLPSDAQRATTVDRCAAVADNGCRAGAESGRDAAADIVTGDGASAASPPPPPPHALQRFMAALLDERERGRVIVSHLYLLAGCAFPFWMYSASSPLPLQLGSGGGGGGAAALHFDEAVSGLVILGVFDSFASVGGSRFGRRHWPGSRKTLEGSLLGFISAWMAHAALHAMFASTTSATAAATAIDAAASGDDGGRQRGSAVQLRELSVALLAATLFEALTTQIDNVVLPTFYVACVELVKAAAAISSGSIAAAMWSE